MNPIFQLLLNAVLNYAKAHPAEVEKLVGVLVQQAIAALSKSQGQA